MKKAPIPANDLERLKELHEYKVLDSAPEVHFDEITKSIQLATGCKIALISLVDKERQWFKSKQGLDTEQTPRDISYCGHAIVDNEVLVIKDASKDERFCDNPLLLGEPNVRFYAGAPLITPKGHRVGTLCVIDSEPKDFSEENKLLLKTLAKQVVNYFEIEKQNKKIKQNSIELLQYSKVLDSNLIVARTTIDGKMTYVNDEFCRISKYEREELIGQDHRIVNSGHHPPKFFKDLWDTIKSGKVWTGELKNRAKDGSFYWVDTNISPIVNKQGEVIEFMAIRYNITQQKESEFLYEETQKVAKVGSWALDLSTMTTEWTDETYRIHDLDPDSQLSKDEGINFYTKEDRPRITKYVTECIEIGKKFRDEFEIITAKGIRKYVQVIGSPDYNSDGKIFRLIGTYQDISEKKINEKTSSDSKKYAQLLFNQSRDAIMTLEPPNWGFTGGNPATLELFGIKNEEEFTKLGLWNVSPEFQPDGAPSSDKVKAEIMKAMEEGSNLFDWTHCSLKGEEISCKVLLSKINDGDKVYLQAIVRDISEQIRYENELKESNQYLDLALEGAGLGIWDWWIQSNNVKFDRRWCEMLGLEHINTEMSLETWTQRVHPDDIDEFYKDINAYLEGKTDYYENVHRMKHANGHWIYILDRGRVSERDSEGNPVRFTGTHLDITEAKQGEEQRLKELNDILSSTPSCLKIITREGKLLDMNKQGIDLIEAPSLEDVYKANVYDIVEESHRQKFIDFNEKVCDGENGNLIFEIIGLEGTRRWMESYAAPYTLPTGEVAHIAITNEITEKVKAEAEFTKQKDIAQHQSKLASIGELAAGVGHEINNPLTIIKGYVSNLLKKVDDLKMKRDLEKVEVASDRIAKIVKGLRTFSRSDVDENEYFNPVEALDESVNLIREIYENEGVSLSYVNKTKNENIQLFSNRGKLQQIFMNLLSNAKDAVLENEVNKNIYIELDLKNDKFIFKVEDNGQGIPEDLQKKIFDPFFTTKDVNKGTGIGLSLVHSFVIEMGGAIDFESTLAKGTCFTTEFKVNESEQKQTFESVSAEEQQKYLPKVLIAEDEEAIRDYLEIILENFGYEVSAFENGQKAFEEFQNNPHKYDIILSDIKMPYMDGETFLKSVRNHKGATQPKFVLLTGGVNINFDDSTNEVNKLIDGWLMKPFEEEELISIITKCLDYKKEKTA